MSHTERLLKITIREGFLSGWEHAQFIQHHRGSVVDTRLVEQMREELAALRAEQAA